MKRWIKDIYCLICKQNYEAEDLYLQKYDSRVWYDKSLFAYQTGVKLQDALNEAMD